MYTWLYKKETIFCELWAALELLSAQDTIASYLIKLTAPYTLLIDKILNLEYKRSVNRIVY